MNFWKNRLWYVSESLLHISYADCVVFKGWQWNRCNIIMSRTICLLTKSSHGLVTMTFRRLLKITAFITDCHSQFCSQSTKFSLRLNLGNKNLFKSFWEKKKFFFLSAMLSISRVFSNLNVRRIGIIFSIVLLFSIALFMLPVEKLVRMKMRNVSWIFSAKFSSNHNFVFFEGTCSKTWHGTSRTLDHRSISANIQSLCI